MRSLRTKVTMKQLTGQRSEKRFRYVTLHPLHRGGTTSTAPVAVGIPATLAEFHQGAHR